mgnify:CR=1 FL=1
MQNNSTKLRATIVGPNRLGGFLYFIKASWPFGSIEIFKDKIIVSPLFFFETIYKTEIISFTNREINKNGKNSIEIIYEKAGVKKRVVCATPSFPDFLQLLKDFDYQF